MQKYNGKDLQLCYADDKEINKIMLGSHTVWEGQRIINLGSGQSWNIKNLYPSLYQKLTSDNFFFRAVNSATTTDSINMRATDTERERGGFTGGLYKSYNASSGVLTAYCYITNDYGSGSTTRANVTMTLVTKPNKLINLGTGQSFSVKARADYASYTGNNFLIKSASGVSWGAMFYPQGYAYSDAGRGTVSITKSYNSSTGVLTGRINLDSVDTSGVYSYYNASTTGNITVYLNPKV